MSGAVTTVLRGLLGDELDADGGTRLGELVRAADPLLSAAEVDRAVQQVRHGVGGLGPLADLLGDDTITDLMVNGDGAVWVDRGRGPQPTGVVLGATEVTLAIERILSPLGRRVNPVDPVVDARLDDGSRVHVVVPPVAVDGPCLTIRRFGARTIALDALAADGPADLLRDAVRHRSNIVVAGGTGSGKTTLLNTLAGHIEPTERVVTVEDAAELRLPLPHVIRLETRPRGSEGLPEIDARELVRNALRMRPDRVLLGEVRGVEALELIQAMNTGHDGSLSTVHANSCEDALRRLETLVLLAGTGLPLSAVRDHLASAIDLLVHIVRDADGHRRIARIAEVCPPPLDGGPRVRILADTHHVVAEPIRPSRRSGAGAT